MIYTTSDTHFGHKNVIRFSNRPFKDIDEMDEGLIKNWNETVTDNDTVYLLGDVSFRNKSQTLDIFKRLNGDIKLCMGNHDQVIQKNQELQKRFSEIRDKYELQVTTTDDDGEPKLLVMSHFPLLVWNKYHHGSWHIHGHCHGSMKYPFKMRILDVGVDVHNYVPISLAAVEAHMNIVVGTETPDNHQSRPINAD